MANTYIRDPSILEVKAQIPIDDIETAASLTPGTEISGIVERYYFDVLATSIGARLLERHAPRASEDPYLQALHDLYHDRDYNKVLISERPLLSDIAKPALRAIVLYPSVPPVIPERRIASPEGLPYVTSFAAMATSRARELADFLRCTVWLQNNDGRATVRKSITGPFPPGHVVIRPHARIT